MATRREKVILELEDRFTTPMARAAAAAAVLERNLDSLDRHTIRTTTAFGDGTKEIDRFSGRLRMLMDTAAILGPGLIPIGAVAVPAVSALASAFGFAAIGAGTAVAAFQGVGDTLKAVNKAALEPTAANLEAAKIAMQSIGPEAQNFVRELQQMGPAFDALRNAAAAGIFPGLTDALGELETALPQVEQILYRVGDALGDMADDAAGALAGPQWAEFLSFVESEAPSALTHLGQVAGSLARGMAELWMAFDPVNDQFTGWMVDAANAFERWADGLSKTEGFQQFTAYLSDNGPRVADALGAMGNAALQIVEAAAPLGGPVLDGLTAVSRVIATIADSDAGPAIMATVTALAALNRGMRAFESASATSWAQSIKGAQGLHSQVATLRQTALRGGGALAGLGLAASGLAGEFEYANTATGALMGALGGPWGAALGGAVGFALDFAESEAAAAREAEAFADTLNQQTGALTENSREFMKNKLYKEGAYDLAERLGVSLEAVTDAALMNKNALAEVNAELDQLIGQTTGENARALADSGLQQLNKDATDLRDILNGGNAVVEEGRKKIRQFGEAGADAGSRAAGGFNQARSAAASFRAEIERVNAVLDRRASFRDYEAALDDFAEALDNVKNKARLLTKEGKINIDLAKGREVQAALDNIASTAIRVAENLRAADRADYLARARRDFIAAAQDLGLTRKAARELAAELGLLDKKEARPKIEIEGWAAAVANADAVQRAIDRVQSKTVTVTVHTVRTGGNGTDFISGGQSTPRLAPRSTAFDLNERTDPVGRLVFDRFATYASSREALLRSGSGGSGFGSPGGQAVAELVTAAQLAAHGLRGLGAMSRDELRERRQELRERERMLERELKQAERRLEEEREHLKALRDARRSLLEDTAANFSTGLFNEVDLAEAIISGDYFTSEVTQDVRDWAAANGMSDASIQEQVEGYLSSLSASQLAALQAQAQAGILQQDTQQAQQFQATLEQLAAMGFDGGAFAQLAASGNLAQAQWLAEQGAEYIDWFEQQYEAQQAAAQAVGQLAGDVVFGDAIKEQVKVTHRMANAVDRLERQERRNGQRLDRIEKAIEREGAKPTGKAVADALNGASAAAGRRA